MHMVWKGSAMPLALPVLKLPSRKLVGLPSLLKLVGLSSGTAPVGAAGMSSRLQASSGAPACNAAAMTAASTAHAARICTGTCPQKGCCTSLAQRTLGGLHVHSLGAAGGGPVDAVLDVQALG